MPQMSPISWTMMIMTTTFMIYITSPIMMFDFFKMSKKKKTHKSKKMNWKW
uniref:ATP synthase F0 subunit 8 n=1 Tax=Aplos simplex TaxID=2837358 RepID=UPI002A816A6E|nr:ATP synthase F0 subunit 8 [Aplos simplex]WOW98869.1 ATP synthase F0 subunit 8 [Aplos simplex]